MQAPTAQVIEQRGKNVTVECPYCRRRHTHVVENMGRRERRAPACGLYRTPAQRAAGYIFTPEARKRNTTPTQEAA